MVRTVIILAISLLLSFLNAAAATTASMESLEAEVLTKFKGTAPATVIQVLGVPSGSTERDGTEYLTWESAKSSGSYIYGVGASESYSCKATFDFVSGALAKVHLLGVAGGDRSLCKKLMKPLLSDSVPSASKGPSAQEQKPTTVDQAAILSNGDIIKLTAAGLADSIILATMNASSCHFDLSPDALVALKQAGVHDPVITGMLSAAKKN